MDRDLANPHADGGEFDFIAVGGREDVSPSPSAVLCSLMRVLVLVRVRVVLGHTGSLLRRTFSMYIRTVPFCA